MQEVRLPKKFPMFVETLHHNIRSICKVAAHWAEKYYFPPGDASIVKRIAEDHHQEKALPIITLWADSVDYAMESYVGSGKKKADWSYKENSVGRRFMIFSDGNFQVRYLRGGYSPKLHDSEFLAIEKDALEREFKHTCIIADEHFRAAASSFTKITWVTPYRKPISKYGKLTKEQKHWNKAITKVRGVIETPFGYLKNNYFSLGGKWREGGDQLDLVGRCYWGYIMQKELGKQYNFLLKSLFCPSIIKKKKVIPTFVDNLISFFWRYLPLLWLLLCSIVFSEEQCGGGKPSPSLLDPRPC